MGDVRRYVVCATIVGLAASGLTALPALSAVAASSPVADIKPAPKGTPQPDPQPVSATDAASKWSLPTVTYPAPGTVTVPVSATGAATAGVVRVADPAALGKFGLPAVPSGHERQPDGLNAPAGRDRWTPDTSSAAPGSVRVTTLDDSVRAQLGNAPMVFTVDRADGGAGDAPVAVSVDYSGWRDAYGGNYAERLQLVRYPACVLTTPRVPGCSTGVPIANQVNDPYQTALTAVVVADGPPAPAPTASSSSAAPTTSPEPAGTAGTLAPQPQLVLPTPVDTASPSPSPSDSPSASPSPSPTDSAAPDSATGSVFAVTSSPSGPSGTYIASPLLPSAHWSVGLSAGSLDYSYPINTPTPPGGPAPHVSLDYDSGSVDGRTSVTNPQASWVGMGWDYEPGFVEREYASCNSLPGHSNADLCYTTSPINVTLTLNGSTTHIIQDTDGTWRLQDDPGWSVIDGTGATNGDTTGEYWRLQSPDGTIYFFGRGVGVVGTAATNSAWTVPVFGYPDTKCSPTGAFTSCTKAWRWNLDYVERTNNNETTYTYAQETNAYNVNGVALAKSYVRGGHVSSITYGLRDGDTSTPVDKVAFGVVARCTAKMNGGTGACPTLGPANASSYPDVPTDLVCTAGATTCTQNSPSFWTVSMMTDVETFTLSSGAYQMLDDYVLQQQLPDPDGTGPEAPALWMSRVQHFGENGAAISTPPLYTYGKLLPNRFDIAAGVSPVDMYRVSEIENETGGYLAVNYDTPDPCTTMLENGDHSQDTLDCFPVHWVPHGSSTWAAGWFNKYLITRAGQYVNYLGELPHDTSRAVTSEPIVTDYEYVGGAAWHKNAYEVNPTLSDSWSVYRGYQTVRVLERDVTGTVIGTNAESVTVHQFYRGMYGDLNNDGTTKTNTVTTAEWGAANDYSWLAGREAEVLVESAGGKLASTTDTLYWTSQTAAMAMPSPNPTEVAREVQPQTTMIRVPNSDGSTRRHEIVDVHYAAPSSRSVSNGAVVTHVDAGDIAGSDVEANCTNILYVANTSRYLMEPEVIATYAGTAAGSSCPGTTTMLGHKELFYDQTSDSSIAPTQGNLRCSKVELDGATYANTYATYDMYGRVISTTDAEGRAWTTGYTPATGRPTSIASTSPTVQRLNAQLLTTTLLDLRGQATQVTDPNGNVSKETYDSLGRLTAAYAPTESAGTAPTFVASYSVNNNGWSTVETKNLLASGGVYRDTWSYLDGWQRTREVHTSSYGGVGHLTVQTRYGDTGEVAAATSPYVNTGALNAGADYTDRASVPLEVDYGYDPAHRVVNRSRIVFGVQSWGHTTTTYYADRTITTPPAPAPLTTATIDVWGRPLVSTETSQVSGDTSSSATTYGYDPLGRLTAVADDGGATNSYTYDLGGRRVSATDADAGTSTSEYDGVGNLRHTTDAFGTTVTTTYDELNRPLEVTSDGHTSPDFPAGALVDYSYDTATLGLGLPASTTVHDLKAGTGDWTTSVGAYDKDGRGLNTTYSMPAVSGQTAAQTYQTSATYNPDGQPATVTDGALGGQGVETLTYGYETTGGVTGLPKTLGGPAGVSVTNTYSTLNQLATRTLGASGAGQVVRSYSFTDALRRLSEITTTANAGSGAVTVQDDAYSYDDVDNPTRINDTLTGTADLNQQTCFSFDGLDRLKRAWTQAANCNNWVATTADAPYGFNQQYAYNANGTPSSVTDLGGTPTSYATTDPSHPHAVTSYGGNSYAYDVDGQQAARTVGGASTSLSWDPLHHLYQSVSGTATTKYVNAPDGSRIARVDPDGSTTIWVAGNEIRVVNGVATATRYYDMGGATVAMRAAGSLTWLASDGQNSRQIAVDATTGAATRTYYLPYGAVRTGAPSLPTDQNFLGRVLDSSGLLQDGARYYDPGIGQFVAPDPLANTSDNSTLDPYGYAASNPVAFADRSGLMNQPNSGGGCGSMSLAQCAGQELADLSIADLVSDGGNSGSNTAGGSSTAGKIGGDAVDIGVQGINDTKNVPTGTANSIKNFFASLFGGEEAAACGASCEATAAQTGSAPPYFGPQDTPDIPNPPDIPMPYQFHGPKVVLTGGGYVVSLLLGGAFGKLGDAATGTRLAAGAGDGFDASQLAMTRTVEQHLGEYAKDGTIARPYGNSPLTVQAIMKAGHPVPDPGGVPGGLRWDVPGALNGRQGTWQLVVDSRTNTILHFLFVRG